ncbi:MAG: DinB family protein [Gemmatimonadota bacterium]
MTQATSSTQTPAQVYVAGLFAVLGSRNPREVLGETAALLRQAVAGLSPAQLSMPEAPGKWSVRQVAQHLADAELVGAFRFRMILAHDGPNLPGYDQDLWAKKLRYQQADIESALGDFEMLRRSNLRIFDGATPEEFKRVMRHEERGDESLEHMLRMYAGHDMVHLRQIARIRRTLGLAEQG